MGEFSMPLAALADDFTRGCDARAFAQFTRAPFVAGEILGDLRFDRERSGANFEVRLPAARRGDSTQNLQRCPHTPPWVAPRADLVP
jgi:hypothetical protein